MDLGDAHRGEALGLPGRSPIPVLLHPEIEKLNNMLKLVCDEKLKDSNKTIIGISLQI